MHRILQGNRSEDAVSPVVGVMLMLVVTIIIAAVVSSFAGGLVGSTEKAPQASFETKIILGSYGNTMIITHLGGDPIDTSRTKLVTIWTNRSTNEINSRQTTVLPYNATPQEYKNGKTVNLTLTTASVQGDSTTYHEPYFVVPGIMPSDDTTLWYGNYILHTGEVMKVEGSLSTNTWYNSQGYKNYSVIKNAEQLTRNDVVTVQLIDIPSGNMIYEKDVYVSGA